MSTGALFLLLLLACPLLMMWMMRGGHGGHGAGGHGGHGASGHAGCGHGGGHDNSQAEEAEPSLDELRQRRDELDRLIEARARSGDEV